MQNILGVPVLINIQFALSKISLPDNVQQAINDAQGAFAGVTKAQAGLQQAAIDAQTNAKEQEGYNACPVCGQMDLLDHLPQGITTYAPGEAFAIGGGGQSAIQPSSVRHRRRRRAEVMRLIDAVLVILVVLLVGYGLFRLVRWFARPSPIQPHTSAWETRYSVEGTQTVWWIFRDITGAKGTRRRESQEIARIDSTASNFDELFVRGERQAAERAFLLNSSLSR